MTPFLRAAVARYRALPTTVKDGGIAAVVTILSFLPGVADKGTALGWPVEQRPFDVLAAGLVLAQALPLAVRSRAPGWCLALTSSAFFVYQASGYRPTLASVGLYIALYSAGTLQATFRVVSVPLWVAGYVGTCAWLIHAGSPFPAKDFVLFFVLPAGFWLLGAWSRSRMREQDRRNDERVEGELRAERERLARELHDVVTHHVTAMVMQSDAAQYLPADDRERLLTGLRAIGTTGRRAITDLRGLLDVLTPENDFRPGSKEPAIGRLGDLVDQTRATGQPVEFIEEYPASDISGLAQLAAYRVVQEGLTNALKHAPGRQTVVRVRGDAGDGLVVEVTTGGDGERQLWHGAPPAPSGRGLAGLSRRVSLAGGTLAADHAADGGFVVRARLPLRAVGR
ncbi:histidine kinase [Amycolatopsis sp., V23-08]|uniref:histidine kinase n=1 Tax=Amycolatopsis heterodermiae TaxID=3110235 RepID=A0ABU5R8Z0_9PSEU|nr:histidine kinase [Amycolatopsis sp., V23-08]MEA5362315.1 histidine kinase [Amycolatopsis sp., V23-08]